MTRIFRERRALAHQENSIVKLRSPQADTHLGAGHLQRTNSHVENIGNLVSTFSSFDEVLYLLKPFWRKLYWLPTRNQERASLSFNCLLIGHRLTPHWRFHASTVSIN